MAWNEKVGLYGRGWRISGALGKPGFNSGSYYKKFLWTPTHQVIPGRPEYGPPRPPIAYPDRSQIGVKPVPEEA